MTLCLIRLSPTPRIVQPGASRSRASAARASSSRLTGSEKSSGRQATRKFNQGQQTEHAQEAVRNRGQAATARRLLLRHQAVGHRVALESGSGSSDRGVEAKTSLKALPEPPTIRSEAARSVRSTGSPGPFAPHPAPNAQKSRPMEDAHALAAGGIPGGSRRGRKGLPPDRRVGYSRRTLPVLSRNRYAASWRLHQEVFHGTLRRAGRLCDQPWLWPT